MALDFGHTCPDIDSNIGDFNEALIDEIKWIIEDSRRHTHEEMVEHKVYDTYAGEIYKQLEHYFEGVRSTNEDMRKQADWQINELEDQLEATKDELEELRESMVKLEELV